MSAYRRVVLASIFFSTGSARVTLYTRLQRKTFKHGSAFKGRVWFKDLQDSPREGKILVHPQP